MSSTSHLDLPIETLVQTVKALQLKQSRLETQQCELKQENAELKAEKRAAKKKKSRSKASKKAKHQAVAAAAGGDGDEDLDSDSDGGPIPLQLGKKFFVCGEPWVIPSYTELFRTPKPRFAYNDPIRYEKTTPEALLSSAVADLHHVVPTKLHKTMSSPAEFQREFGCGYGDGHSAFIHMVRSLMPLLFGLNTDYFIKDKVNMRRSPEVAKYLKFDLEEPKYPSLPPFLFPDQVFDLTKAFRMDHLVKALGAMLRGRGWAMGHRGGTPKTSCDLWSVHVIDECMITMAATIRNNGVLDLYTFYQTCKQLLIGGRDTAYFKDLLRWYQENIFGTSQASETICVEPTPEDCGRVAKDYLRQLRAAIPAGNAVAGPSSSSPIAPPASPVAQHVIAHLVSESSRSDSRLDSDSDSASAFDLDSDSDSDSDSSSDSPSDSSDDGVGGTDGEELYRNIVSAPTTSRHLFHSDSLGSLPHYDAPLSTPTTLHVQSTVPPPLRMPAPHAASIRSIHTKPSSMSISTPPSPPPSTPISEIDIAPSRSDSKSKDKGKRKAIAVLDDSSDVVIVNDSSDLVVVESDPMPPVNLRRWKLRARPRLEEADVEKAEKVTKVNKKADKKADKKKPSKGTVVVTEDAVDAEAQVAKKQKLQPRPKKKRD